MMMVRLLHPEDLLNGNLRETQFMNISTKESYRVEYIPPMPCEQCMLESKILLLMSNVFDLSLVAFPTKGFFSKPAHYTPGPLNDIGYMRAYTSFTLLPVFLNKFLFT